MDIKQKILNIVEAEMHCKAENIFPVGKGASGSVYCVSMDKPPYKIAVKYSEHYSAMCKEKYMLEFLSSRVSYKVPKTYFINKSDEKTFLGIEYIEGLSGKSSKLIFLRNKKHLANNIVDAFMDTQSVHNDKFGNIENPEYDTWQEYYKKFFDDLYVFTKEKYAQKEISHTVMTVVHLVHINFDEIFKDTVNQPCLSHGDFWMPNMIIDKEKCELAGVLDPFNMLWAEPEYELFSLTMGFGKRLRLYDIYKSRAVTTKYCDLKVEIYALCNELHWYKWLNSISHNYLEFRSKRIIKQIKLNHLKQTDF